MNILYSFRTRGVGAESVHISGIANAFESLGHKVHFESPTGVDPRRQKGENPFHKKKGHTSIWNTLAGRLPGFLFELAEIAYNFRNWFRIRAHLRCNQYGLIYERHAFFLCATGFVAKRKGIPLVVEVNELVGDERIRRQPLLLSLARWCDRQLFQRAALIVVVSPHLKRKISERHQIPAEKIQVHPNAVDASLLEKSPNPEIFRQQFELQGKLNLGFVGWFVEWHRLEFLIEIFARLCREQNGPKLNLLLVGDGPLRESLTHQVSELGISGNVTFTGTIEHTHIPAILRAIEIAVIPHSNEYRSPIKLFEYMAQECAIVAPKTEPISTVVENNANGLLFKPLDKEHLYSSLKSLVMDTPLREQLGQAARKSVESRHTWKHNAQEILQRMKR